MRPFGSRRKAGLSHRPSSPSARSPPSIVTVSPGQGRVLQFVRSDAGTACWPGFWCAGRADGLLCREHPGANFDTTRLKVNDADGNPVEIAAIVVWQVADTAKAVYRVDDYPAFVSIQSESALRHVANGHPNQDTQGVGTPPRGLRRRR